MENNTVVYKRMDISCIDGKTVREYDLSAKRVEFLENSADVVSIEAKPYRATLQSSRDNLSSMDQIEMILGAIDVYEHLISDEDAENLMDIIEKIKYDIEKGLEEKEAEALIKYNNKRRDKNDSN